MADSIPLIVPAGAPEEVPATDRLGGEQHGFIPRIFGRAVRDIPADQFGAQMEQIVSKVQAVTDRLKSAIGEYSVDEIKIGLAVTTEGTIGVATAGVEASIEVKLKRRGAPPAGGGGAPAG